MRGTDGDALASGGAPAAEHGSAGIGLHARPKAVRFRAVAAIGLKCSFGHRDPLLFPKENLRFSSNIEYIAGEFQNPAEEAIHDVARERSDSSYAEGSGIAKRGNVQPGRCTSVTRVTRERSFTILGATQSDRRKVM
jgi:hypothetical protein